jgi:thiol:disulfide interchange protein DsbD
MERALLTLLAVISILILARGILPAAATAQTTAAASLGGPEVEQSGNLKWFLNRDDAFAEAKKRGKPVFVDFYGSWCANCKAFEVLTHTNEALRKALAGAVLLKIRDTSPDFKVWQNDSRFPELKVGLPFFVIMDAAGNLLYKTSDYTRIEEMILFLEG